jgi:hypothetical protein
MGLWVGLGCAHGSVARDERIAQTYLPAARLRGSAALACPDRALGARYLGGGGVVIEGCGMTQSYTCTTTIVATRHDVVCQPDGPPSGTHVDAPAEQAPASDSADVGRARAAIARCGLAPETTVAIYVGVEGDLLRVEEPRGESDRACIDEALRGVTFATRSDAELVTFPVAPPAPAAAPAPVTPPTPDAGTETAARRAIDAMHDAILACTGGAAIAVVGDWTDDGALTIHLPDARAGTAEDGCVRAAAAGARVDPAPGQAGSVLHALH